MRSYPAASYHRLYDSTLAELWTPERGLAPDEDGDHYSPERDFFEWWYFDAAFNNGFRLVAILHSSLYNAVDHKPTVDIRITPPGEKSLTAIGRYTRSEYRSASGCCDVRLAGCHAVEEGPGQYRLQLRQGAVTADLLYQAEAPGWRPGTGYLFFDEATGHYFKWVVPLPLARVTGYIEIGGERMQVSGSGYHDHNWGNFVLADAFSRWTWGRFLGTHQGETWALVFGDVAGRGYNRERVRPFLLSSGGIVFKDIPKISLHEQQIREETTTRVKYPAQLDLEAHSESYAASLSIRAGRILEALDFANPIFRRRLPRQLAEIAFYLSYDKPLLGRLARKVLGKGSYLRMDARAELVIIHPQAIHLAGDALYEIMQF
jgi:hypothetical protein